MAEERQGLPVPHEGMTPEEKGALLLRYVASDAPESVSGMDFGGALLVDAQLQKADLRGVGLAESNLTGADLRSSNLRGANLTRANLTRANLYKADVGEANLTGAMLRDADCNSAHLDRSVLRGADLSDADFCGADLCEAYLVDANLQGTDVREATYRPPLGEDLQPELLRLLWLGGCGLPDMPTWSAGLRQTVTNGLEGLTLYFNSRLFFIQESNVQLAIRAALGPDEDCTYSVQHQPELTTVTLDGCPEADLFRVAAQLSLWAHRPLEAPSIAAVQAPRPQRRPRPVPLTKPASRDQADALLRNSQALPHMLAAMESRLRDEMSRNTAQVTSTIQQELGRMELRLTPEAIERLNALGEGFIEQADAVGLSLESKTRRLILRSKDGVGQSVAASALFEVLKQAFVAIAG